MYSRRTILSRVWSEIPWQKKYKLKLDYQNGIATVGHKASPFAYQIGKNAVPIYITWQPPNLRTSSTLSQTFKFTPFYTSKAKKSSQLRLLMSRASNSVSFFWGLLDVLRDKLPNGGHYAAQCIKSLRHLQWKDRLIVPSFKCLQQSSEQQKCMSLTCFQRKNIGTSKFLHAASFFFVNEKDKVRGLIDFRALKKMRKPNPSTFTGTDEMFWRLRGWSLFSRLDLKNNPHQICVSSKDFWRILSLTPSMDTIDFLSCYWSYVTPQQRSRHW